MLAQLGVQVTLVEILEDIVALLDADVRRELRRQMEKTLGIRILTGQSLENITADERAVRGTVGEKQSRRICSWRLRAQAGNTRTTA